MKQSKSLRVVSIILLIASLFTFAASGIGGALMLKNANATPGTTPTETTPVNPDLSDAEYYKSAFTTVAEVKKSGEKYVETIAQEGITLLKNENNALPLQENAGVSFFSTSCVSPIITGTGSGSYGASVGVTSLKEGCEQAGLKVNSALWDWYDANFEKYGREKYGGTADTSFTIGVMFTIGDTTWNEIGTSAKTDSTYGDAAIFVLSRTGGEGVDSTIHGGSTSDMTDGNYLKLSPKEKDVLKNLKLQKDAGVFKRIIVLMNTANPVECEFVDNPQYGIDALLWVGTLGQTGANAVGNILAGKVNPSGRLPDTFWKYHYLNPVLANAATLVSEFGSSTQWAVVNNVGAGKHIVYQEGIYMGYRYTETRYEDTVLKDKNNVGNFNYYEAVSYPFGYGLSYSTFAYSNMNVEKAERTTASGAKEPVYKVSVDVTNTGSVAGKETVQLYLQKPYTDYDKQNFIEKASAELVGFGKTNILQPNETQTITIEVNEREFATYDAYNAKTYIVDAGDYYFTVAKNAHAAVNNILAAKGKTTADGMTEDGDSKLVKTFTMAFDNKTYSTSAVTGAAITNQFEDVDLKLYEGSGENKDKLQYITRSNWEGTVKLGLTKDNKRTNNFYKVITTPKMQEDLNWGYDYKVEPDDGAYPTYGSNKTDYKLIDLRAYEDGDGDPTNNVWIPYDDPMWDDFLDQLTWDDTVTLLSSNLRKTAAVESIGKPETIDQNGGSGPCVPYNIERAINNGLAMRNDDPDKAQKPAIYPCSGLVAATFNKPLAYDYGRQWGEDCMWAGYAGLYGMGVNTHRSAYGGRNFEYYSEDPVLMGQMAAECTKGMSTCGIYVYLKHCFLNDQETYRCGAWTWANEQTLREIYLKSFQIAIEVGGATCVMGGLNSIGMKWTGVQGFMNTVLRGEFGLKGHIVTDSYGCYNGSYIKGLCYGNDIPDGTVDPEKETFDYAAPKYGGKYASLAWAMREAAHRVLYSVVHSSAMNGYTPTHIVYQPKAAEAPAPAPAPVVAAPAWVKPVQIGSAVVFGIGVLLLGVSIYLDVAAKRKQTKETA